MTSEVKRVAHVKCRKGGSIAIVIREGEELELENVVHRPPPLSIDLPDEMWPVEESLKGSFRCPDCAATSLALCDKCFRLSCADEGPLQSKCEWGCGLGTRVPTQEGAQSFRVWSDV